MFGGSTVLAATLPDAGVYHQDLTDEAPNLEAPCCLGCCHVTSERTTSAAAPAPPGSRLVRRLHDRSLLIIALELGAHVLY